MAGEARRAAQETGYATLTARTNSLCQLYHVPAAELDLGALCTIAKAEATSFRPRLSWTNFAGRAPVTPTQSVLDIFEKTAARDHAPSQTIDKIPSRGR